MIFRRQIIYFIVLIMVEIPYTCYILSIGYIAPKLKDPYYYALFMEFKKWGGFFAFTFLSRGIWLSLLRMTEPAFVKKLKGWISSTYSTCFGKDPGELTMNEASISAANIKDYL